MQKQYGRACIRYEGPVLLRNILRAYQFHLSSGSYVDGSDTDHSSFRDDEAAFLSDLTESRAQGTTWDRICKLIELKDSQSKTLARAGPGTTELLRFREVLLRLRREGESAPGAAGY